MRLKNKKERKIFYNVTYHEDEQKAISKANRWVAEHNENPKKTRIVVPKWWDDAYTLKNLYTGQFKRKKYLKVVGGADASACASLSKWEKTH